MRTATRLPIRRLLFLALMLLATGFATVSNWQPAAQARPCCSSCPPDDLENHCWDVCSFSC
jgi:hypothetical protein